MICEGKELDYTDFDRFYNKRGVIPESEGHKKRGVKPQQLEVNKPHSTS
jgi:hypothetical protein